MTWRVGLSALALAAVVAVLWRGAAFVRLACIALVLAAALQSPVGALVRHGWRRGLAIAAVCTAVVALLVALGGALGPRMAPQLQQAVESIPDVTSSVRETPEYRWLAEHQLIGRAVSAAHRHTGAAVESILSAAAGVLSFFSGLVTVVALAVFLLASGPRAWSWILGWIHPARRGRVRRLGSAARSAVAGYVGGVLVMGAIAATVTGVTTALLGVPFFLALAAVTFVLGLVPFIGAIVSAIVVVATTFLTAGTTAGVVTLVVFLAYQQLEGAVLQPLVQRHAVEMSPLVVLSAVLFGLAAGGVWGGVIALPLVAAGKVVLEDVRKHRRAAWRGAHAGRTGVHPSPPIPH
jgi:predicted PurR-regulated permease PerM